MSRRIHNPKFSPGDIIDSPDMLQLAAKAGRYIYLNCGSHAWQPGRAYHPTWVLNMNFACVMGYLKTRRLRLAIRNPEYPYVFKAEFMEDRFPETTSQWWVTCSELPEFRCTEITKEAVIRECVAAASKVGSTKVEVRFKKTEDEIEVQPVKLLQA